MNIKIEPIDKHKMKKRTQFNIKDQVHFKYIMLFFLFAFMFYVFMVKIISKLIEFTEYSKI